MLPYLMRYMGHQDIESKKITADRDRAFFWTSASGFLNNKLPDIRKKSPNTVEVYRRSLNEYIDFLEGEKSTEGSPGCAAGDTKTGRRNRMILNLGYDAACVSAS